MILNSKISCVVGISIFGFDKHQKTLFNLREFNISPTFKQLFHAKKINANKTKHTTNNAILK